MTDAPSASEPSVLRRALEVAESVPVTLVGTSMWPLISGGARGRLVRCRVEELRRFDVAVYERHGTLVAHLVHGIGAEGPRAAALGREPDERPLTRDELLGRLSGVVVRRTQVELPRNVARGVVALATLAMRLRLRTR